MLVGETKIGETYRFNYPIEFITLPEYSAHRGQPVKVIRECTEDEAGKVYDEDKGVAVIVDTMFVVQAADGWQGHAWDSELEPL